MNRRAAQLLQIRFGLKTLPSAVQARIGGAKGMFLLHPEDNWNEPRIWYRDSQNKINIPRPDRSQLTFDLVRPPHLKFPARLSSEITINLSHNGVGLEVIEKLFINGLKAEIAKMSDWEGEGAMSRLWQAVYEEGRTASARLRRLALGASRALGLVQRDDDDDGDVDEELLEEFVEQSVAWYADEVSGLPSTLSETIMKFLSAGFNPMTCPVLHDKLKNTIGTMIDNYRQKFKIGVPQSAEGFAVPGAIMILSCWCTS